jgi:Kef-type K+ transport system membrane component KefB
MSHDDTVRFFLQLAVLLLSALAGGLVARRLRLPAVAGELLAGILLGPTLLGALAPSLHAWLWVASVPSGAAREAVVKLGLLGFLFAAGLEMDLGRARARLRETATVSLLGIAVPFLLGAAAVAAWPGLFHSDRLDPWWQSVFVGTALSISAVPVIARILIDLDLQHTDLAVVILSAAVIDDLVGWSLFTVLLGRAAPDAAHTNPLLTLALVALVVLFLLTAGRSLAERIRPWGRSRLPGPGHWIGVAVVGVLAAAALVEAIGVHAVFGAFVAGLVLARPAERNEPVRVMVRQIALGVLSPLYFVSIGLKVDFVKGFDLELAIVVLALAAIGKIGGVTLGASLAGMPPRVALQVGLGMNARGAMEVLLASLAFEAGLIDARLLVALVIMAMATSILSGPAMAWLQPRPRRAVPEVPRADE